MTKGAHEWSSEGWRDLIDWCNWADGKVTKICLPDSDRGFYVFYDPFQLLNFNWERKCQYIKSRLRVKAIMVRV